MKTISSAGFHRFLSIYALRRVLAYAVIAVALVLAYLPTFSGDFIFDDRTLVRDNPYVTKLQSIESYLSQEDGIVDERDKGIFHTGYYRPLMNITYYIDYRLWGMNAAGFRTTNLIFHLLVCLILYELTAMLTKQDVWSFLGVLLFALHPVQTESVSMIVARNNIFATLFILMALFGYIRWWDRKSPLALVVSLVACIGAVFSKELGIMVLPIIFFYQRLINTERDRKREIVSYMPYLIIIVVYLILRGQVVSTSVSLPDDVGQRLFFIPYLIAYNLRLVMFPYGLHFFHVSYPMSLMAPPVLFSLVIFCLLAIGAYHFRRERLMLFSCLAFFISLIPVLNVVSTVSVSLIAMRWLYLPLAFLSIGIVAVLRSIPERRQTLTLICGLLISLYFGAYAHILNKTLWQNEDVFLRQEVNHFRNTLYIGDYAERLFELGDVIQAEKYFSLALTGKDVKVRDYINYGALFIETQRPAGAVRVLEDAAAIKMNNKDHADWHNNLGAALILMNQLDRAEEHLRQALILNGKNPVILRNFAALLVRQGRLSEAASHLDAAKVSERTHEKP